MKPKEFDELVRQKFDQNDFAYSPGNWDRLAEQLDGRAKKRSMFMWLWMPALGMAASVALAIGVTGMLKFGAPAGSNAEYTQTSMFVMRQPVQDAVAMVTEKAAAPAQSSPAAKTSRTINLIKDVDNNKISNVGIKLSNVLSSNTAVIPEAVANPVDLAAAPASPQPQNTPKKKLPVVETPGYNTFTPEEVAVKKPARFSIILSGGINQGSGTSGYAAGATVRRMINDKVYVESDIAFASSDLIQSSQYHSNATAAKVAAGAKVSKVESTTTTQTKATPEGPLVGTDKSYNLYYAQVSPSIGYKILKRMSIAAGPDFQKALADNRPAISQDFRGNIQVAPLFDVGFIGKTEYKLTNKVKAAVSYRKGINGILTPSDKYIDRDYLQFQVKCVIFNK